MRIFSGLFGLAINGILATSAIAACGPDSLGTSRTMKVDTSKYREYEGHEKRFGLRHKEVILTFDDGPIAGKTPRILNTLKKECVKATFFYVGRMAKHHPSLVRRVVREGHTLAHHTYNHSRMTSYGSQRGGELVDRGIRQLQKIAYGTNSSKPRVPFFRYPYLARSKRTDKIIRARGMVAFGANIDSLDWKQDSANTVHNRIMKRLRREGKGIILMHDIQNRTAKMLPRLLRSLKNEGYKVVHMVPKGYVKPKSDPVVVASLEKPKPKKSSIVSLGVPSDKEVAAIVKQAEKDLPVVTRNIPKKPTIEKVALKKSVKRKLKKRQLASNTKRGNGKPQLVASKKWKLRRSQWIIN